MVGDPVASFLELIRIRAHRGEKQDDLLLVMLYVGAQADVFGHEHRRVFRRRQVLAGKTAGCQELRAWSASLNDSRARTNIM